MQPRPPETWNSMPPGPANGSSGDAADCNPAGLLADGAGSSVVVVDPRSTQLVSVAAVGMLEKICVDSSRCSLNRERKMDSFGNQVGSTDGYGNPIPGHGTAGGYGEHGAGGQQLHGAGGQQFHAGGAQNVHGDGVTPGVLRRSGSSSSSSSEDDGLGGRRKKDKGIKDKIKEKLPGGHKGEQNPQHHYDQGVAAGGQTHEKKGVMEKIKETLPGSHSH